MCFPLITQLSNKTRAQDEASKALTNSKDVINSKLIQENPYDQYKEISVFEVLQDGSKQKAAAFMVYRLAIV